MPMKRKNVLLASLVMILLLCYIVMVAKRERQEISISVGKESLQYIIANTGSGPKRLEYKEHQEIVDYLIAMLNGKYTYKESWSNDGKSGGGPYLIEFHYSGKETEYVKYLDGYIAMSLNKKGDFSIYEKNGENISFNDFETYLKEYGE